MPWKITWAIHLRLIRCTLDWLPLLLNNNHLKFQNATVAKVPTRIVRGIFRIIEFFLHIVPFPICRGSPLFKSTWKSHSFAQHCNRCPAVSRFDHLRIKEWMFCWRAVILKQSLLKFSFLEKLALTRRINHSKNSQLMNLQKKNQSTQKKIQQKIFWTKSPQAWEQKEQNHW